MIGDRVISGVMNHNHAPNKAKQRRQWISNMQKFVDDSGTFESDKFYLCKMIILLIVITERKQNSKRAELEKQRNERNDYEKRNERIKFKTNDKKVESWLAGLPRAEENGNVDITYLKMSM